MNDAAAVYDFVIVGSGFGGSVSAIRLTERGHRVLVSKRAGDSTTPIFATSTWNTRRYLWMPRLRCFGILQISPVRHVWVLHGVSEFLSGIRAFVRLAGLGVVMDILRRGEEHSAMWPFFDADAQRTNTKMCHPERGSG